MTAGLDFELDQIDRPVISFQLTALAVPMQLSYNGVRLRGWSFENTAAGGSGVTLYSGESNASLIVARIRVAGTSGQNLWLGERGVDASRGLYLDPGVAILTGVIWYSLP